MPQQVPSFDDQRLSEFVRLYESAANEIQDLLDDLLVEDSQKRRKALYESILVRLRDLQAKADTWSVGALDEFAAKADQDALRTLKAAGIQAEEALSPAVVEDAAKQLRGNLDKATESIRDFATKVYRNKGALERGFPGLEQEVKRQQKITGASLAEKKLLQKGLEDKVRERTKSGIVGILGKDGRTYRFSLPYYAAMVGQNVQNQIFRGVTLARAEQMPVPLVRVSANRSKGRDYCDAYAGRVFALGPHPRFPSIHSTPNGGPPFHPFCRHTLFTHIEQPGDDQFLAPDFALLGEGESPNRMIREFWQRKKAGESIDPVSR